MAEVLVHKAYDFAKTEQLKLAIAKITGEGLGIVEGDEHKVSTISLIIV